MDARLALERSPMTSGSVIWITGLSAAGKSTVARAVVDILRQRGLPTLLLDADDVRAAIADPGIGHDPASRRANAYRIARLARLLAGQETIVVVPTVSLFREIHVWNRAHLSGYFEVLLHADMRVCLSRDPKGLYSRVLAGEERNVVGVDIAAEFPSAPDLAIVNDGDSDDISRVAKRIVDAFLGSRCARDVARGAAEPTEDQ
jgi:adenylylsulfate kinase